MFKKIIFLTIFFVNFCVYAQKNVNFLPEGLHFKPLIANVYEPRIGVLYFPDDRSLKVDIGNSIDIIEYNNLLPDTKISLGIDFMAYGLASSYEGKRLQIDALDGFFGGNATASVKVNKTLDYKFRFRIIHNSAHLVDGSYNSDKGTWKNNYLPVPYARDFMELTFVKEKNFSKGDYRLYCSPSYSVLIRPEILKRWSFNSGIELYFNNILGEILEKESNMYLAYHFSLIGTPIYNGNNTIIAGVKLGDVYTKGINFYFSYHMGMHYFSEYFSKRLNKFGIGFNVEF
ncbi:MAG TPA: hypothetical protein PL041_03580 [Melioribacteraceae bacterium]|nr:hypothetical protein [Melioribacteraceae bacterium]